MKIVRFIIIITIGFGLFSCDNSGSGKLSTDVVGNTKTADADYDKSAGPRFQFEETEHNFGKLIQGEKVSYSFKFTNTGGADILINKVSTSCGCTIGNYPKTPIKPGGSGSIDVTFNSYHKKGHQNKTVAIMANTEPNRTTLRVKARVMLPEKN